MSQIIKLELSKPYPLPIPSEGMTVELLRNDNNLVIVALPNMSMREKKAIRTGKIHCGLLSKGESILLLWRFFDKNDKIILTFDTPFDSRVIPDAEINLWDIKTPCTRMCLDVRAVDTDSTNLVAMRVVTFTPELTREFMMAVQEQYSLQHIKDMPHLNAVWLKENHDTLCSMVVMHTLGQP